MIRFTKYFLQVLAPPVNKGEKGNKKDKKHGIDQLMKESFSTQRSTNDDKIGQNFIDYVAEYSTVANDGLRKKQADVDRERQYALGCERFLQKCDADWDLQMQRAIMRQNEALESLPKEFIEEATIPNTQPYPLNMSRPKLTPPIYGYEPAYGMDVPQLRAEVMEYPLPTNTEHTDDTQDTTTARQFTLQKLQEWKDALGGLRSEYPYTGPEGEQFEMYCALNIRALERQLLILDIHDDPEGLGKQMECPKFASEERIRRGINGIEVSRERDVVSDGPPKLHEAQCPQYHPFRYV